MAWILLAAFILLLLGAAVALPSWSELRRLKQRQRVLPPRKAARLRAPDAGLGILAGGNSAYGGGAGPDNCSSEGGSGGGSGCE